MSQRGGNLDTESGDAPPVMPGGDAGLEQGLDEPLHPGLHLFPFISRALRNLSHPTTSQPRPRSKPHTPPFAERFKYTIISSSLLSSHGSESLRSRSITPVHGRARARGTVLPGTLSAEDSRASSALGDHPTNHPTNHLVDHPVPVLPKPKSPTSSTPTTLTLAAVSLSIAFLSAGHHVLALLSLVFTVYFVLLGRAWGGEGERDVLRQQMEEEKGKVVVMRPVSAFLAISLITSSASPFYLFIYLTAKT